MHQRSTRKITTEKIQNGYKLPESVATLRFLVLSVKAAPHLRVQAVAGQASMTAELHYE